MAEPMGGVSVSPRELVLQEEMEMLQRGGGKDSASKEGGGAVRTDAKWWEDGNADDDFLTNSPITVQNKTMEMPRFFDGEMERVPDATMDQIAKVRWLQCALVLHPSN